MVCYSIKQKSQAQEIQKHMVKPIKSITLPSFSTTNVWGHTKLKGHGLKLNLIAEPSENNQLLSSVQCSPSYCNLEASSNRVTVGLRNVSAKQITVPSRMVVCQIQPANMVPKLQTPTEQDPSEHKEDNSLILNQIDLGEISTWSVEQQQAAKKLLCDYSDCFSKNDLSLGKCNILKHKITLTDYQPFPPHLFEEVKQHLKEMVELGAIRRSFSPWASAVVLVMKKDGGLRLYIYL